MAMYYLACAKPSCLGIHRKNITKPSVKWYEKTLFIVEEICFFFPPRHITTVLLSDDDTNHISFYIAVYIKEHENEVLFVTYTVGLEPKSYNPKPVVVH